MEAKTKPAREEQTRDEDKSDRATNEVSSWKVIEKSFEKSDPHKMTKAIQSEGLAVLQ